MLLMSQYLVSARETDLWKLGLLLLAVPPAYVKSFCMNIWRVVSGEVQIIQCFFQNPFSSTYYESQLQ